MIGDTLDVLWDALWDHLGPDVPFYALPPDGPAGPYVLVHLEGVRYRQGLWSVLWRCQVVASDSGIPSQRASELYTYADRVLAACASAGVAAETTAAGGQITHGDITTPTVDVTTAVAATGCALPEPIPRPRVTTGGTARG